MTRCDLVLFLVSDRQRWSSSKRWCRDIGAILRGSRPNFNYESDVKLSKLFKSQIVLKESSFAYKTVSVEVQVV